MYLNFYGLKEKPFNPTPDPKFLYLTPGHREALSQLVYGVREHKGFIVLTGEVGTGKTTLLRTLLTRLDGNTAVAFIFNSTLPFDELLEYMLHDFGIAKAGETRVERLVTLNNFLIERRRAGQNTVVIFDEAQNLDAPTLERVRLLSNFETSTDKLLQILLVGQPELGAKLRLPELRQLRQRVGLRCAIPPLRPEETRDYIRSRLRIAGARDLNLFTDRAARRITEHAGGIPRVINMVCDHCLLIGYADQTRRIDTDIVERAIKYLEEGELPLRKTTRGGRAWVRPLRWALGAVAAGAVGLLAGLALQSSALPPVLSTLHAWLAR
jgi:general secretion pathway protein A